jgi:aspartyl-tRNA synthetase
VAELADEPGRHVRLCGWAHCVDLAQLVLRDHSGRVALRVARGGMPGAVAATLRPDAAIEVLGKVARTPDGGVCVAVEKLTVHGPSAGPLPIAPDSPLDERLDWRYVDLRRPRNRLIFEVQTTALSAMRDVWLGDGYIELHSPKLRPIPNKSGDELFSLEYFGRRAYLAQSPQFYKQMAMAAGFERVFDIGPVFRQQPEASTRHDTEFTSVDVEISWIDALEDLLVAEEELLCRVLGDVVAAHGEAVQREFGRTLSVPSIPFPRMTIGEAKAVVAATGWPAGQRDDDLDPEGERRLAAHVLREHGHEFVYITDYPELARPFYHMRNEPDSVATRSFDLLYNGLEITSGAQREHRYEQLVAQARGRGLPVDHIRQYLEFFKFGCPPHGGFGLGLTRMLMSMLGVADVREVTYLFRGPDRISP